MSLKFVSPLALLFALGAPLGAQPAPSPASPTPPANPAPVAPVVGRPLVTRLQALSGTTFLLKWSDPTGTPTETGASTPPIVQEYRVYRDRQLIATLGADVHE